MHLVTTLRMEKFMQIPVDRLSGGEKERVSIIKAMAHKPSILLLDEPGSSLNHELKHIAFDLIRLYCQKAIGIAASHDESFIDYTYQTYDMESYT